MNDDPASATWTDLLIDLSGAPGDAWTTISPVSLLGLSSEGLVVAFKYVSTGEDAGQGKEIGIDNVLVEKGEGAIALSSNFSASSSSVTTTADMVSFAPYVNGGTRPYTFAWDFGDGMTSTDASPSHQFTTPGSYSVSLTVKDAENNELAKSVPDLVTVIDADVVLVLNDFDGADDSAIQLPWTSFSAASEAVWLIDTFDSQQGAFMNGFGTDDVSDDWLISPAFAVAGDEIAILAMDFYTFFEGGTFDILVSNDYDPAADEDPGSATWTAADVDLSGEGWGALANVELPVVRGDSVHLAFHYTSTGVDAGESRRIGVDNVVVIKAPAPEPDQLTYAGWIEKNDYFEGGDPNGEPGADPDKDGLTNEVEFRFNLHPLRGYGFENLPALTQQGDTLMLTYQRIADGDNRWVVQLSPDLANWIDAEEGTQAQTTIVDIGEPTDFLQSVNVLLTPAPDQSQLYWRVVLPTE